MFDDVLPCRHGDESSFFCLCSIVPSRYKGRSRHNIILILQTKICAWLKQIQTMIRLFRHLNIFLPRMKMLSINYLLFFHQQRSKKRKNAHARVRTQKKKKKKKREREMFNILSLRLLVFFLIEGAKLTLTICHLMRLSMKRSFKRVDFVYTK